MMSRQRPNFVSRRRQRGVSLAVSLILLVVATLVALGSMRGVLLQSRMSGTTHDRSLAFQAAEAALRDAETLASTANSASFPANGCNAEGFCVTPAPAATPRWLDAAFAGWRSAAATTVPPAAPVPDAIVEDMGEAPNIPGCENAIPRLPNCMSPRYQITARSTADGRASVLVQSQYAAP